MHDTPVIRAVLRAQWREVSRDRWILAYAILVALLTEAVLRLSGTAPRALAGLLNVVLLLVPLMTAVFGVTYWHAARDFTELLLAQPVARARLWWGLYLGLAAPLAAAFTLGLLLPLLWHRAISADTIAAIAVFAGTGVALTAIFTAIALWLGVRATDRLRAIGQVLGAWLVLTLVYDGLIIAAATTFAHWPLERVLLAAMFLNPVDLARTLLMFALDHGALMGYTGALLARFLNAPAGRLFAAAGLLAWMALPIVLARRTFVRKDF